MLQKVVMKSYYFQHLQVQFIDQLYVFLLQGLFRKILTGKISPDKLVLMSTEDLASRELAKWREQESKHVSEKHIY